MLIRQETLQGILDGSVTLQFRSWRRATVKKGGTLLTSIGLLAIDDVAVVLLDDITAKDAQAAGFADRDDLVAQLQARPDSGQLYRIELRYAGPDPRIALREQAPDADEIESIRQKLERWDRASPVGPWTTATLDVIAARPAVLAGDLADDIGMERARFKTNVRKLKGLGLTESLKTGYRLSPRGEALRRLL